MTPQATRPTSPFDLRLVALCMIAGGATHFGWRKLWFLTDDAFIAFRYVSNSMLGRGLVWNPEPFAPVEGYTSFLWVMILRGVWWLTGIEPPESANSIALGFGYATLLLGAAIVARMRLPAHAERLRFVLLALVLAWTITNRTFLTWLSSGLEASLFTFSITYWVWAATRWQAGVNVFVAHLATASSIAALTRPDGLLFALFAVVIAGARVGYEGRAALGWRLACALLPGLCIPAHLLFRYVSYGYWVPNTYFAKYVEPWPESGLRYVASFGVEYGLWLWLIVALGWAVIAARGPARRSLLASLRSESTAAILALVCAALLAHFSYYTWIIGGDHFEYRVYAHLILLLGIALVWMASRITARPALIVGMVALVIASSWPVAWTHWTLNKSGRDAPIAKHMPAAIRPVIAAWDGWQRWLSDRSVCDRHHVHKRFLAEMKATYPRREKGARLKWDDRPIIARRCVGLVAWSLPNVAVIDVLGLNDRIVARNDIEAGNQQMAHDRKPPEGYVECFRPNVNVHDQKARARKRKPALTDDEIRACDAMERWIDS